MSRVTQRPFGEPDERVPDCLAIATLAIAKPAKPDQFVDRRFSYRRFRGGIKGDLVSRMEWGPSRLALQGRLWRGAMDSNQCSHQKGGQL
jgi:hypothetical protein